jgi:hypothetical protein
VLVIPVIFTLFVVLFLLDNETITVYIQTKDGSDRNELKERR